MGYPIWTHSSESFLRLYQKIEAGVNTPGPLLRPQFWEGLCQRGALNSKDLPKEKSSVRSSVFLTMRMEESMTSKNPRFLSQASWAALTFMLHRMESWHHFFWFNEEKRNTTQKVLVYAMDDEMKY